ncbi:MAG TPA: hypothetical protein VHK91_04365 [Flavisolibacter sp.]|jgi:hypothetical protein|nr:hypothetical protein [Flavisolibacter sp.]
MKKVTIIAFSIVPGILFGIESCGNRSNDASEILKSSTVLLHQSNEDLSQRINDLTTPKKDLSQTGRVLTGAAESSDNIRAIQQLSDDILSYLKQAELKADSLFSRSGNSSKDIADRKSLFLKEMYSKVSHYIAKTLKLNSWLSKNLAREVPVIFKVSDALTSTVSEPELRSLIEQYRHKVLSFEYKALEVQISEISFEDFTIFNAIIAQSSTCLKPGDTLTITAGIGAFTRKNDPAIQINRKNVPLDDQNVAIQKMKITSIPGRYVVPIKVQYTDQDGKAQYFNQIIRYEVKE